jgi:hypothetical protein
MKVVHCPCGKNVEGETDDQHVNNVEEHYAKDHSDMVGKYSREQIWEMAHEHCQRRGASGSGERGRRTRTAAQEPRWAPQGRFRPEHHPA